MTNTNERFDEQLMLELGTLLSEVVPKWEDHSRVARLFYKAIQTRENVIKTFISNKKELAVQEERQAWIDGKRCTSCGKAKEKDLADWCGECFENN